MRYIFIICILYSTCTTASFDMNSRMEQSYLSIIDLNFGKAISLLDIEKNNNTNNSIIHLNENYIDILKTFILDEQNYYDATKKNKNIRINKLQEEDKNSPYYLYVTSEIYLQWAFCHLKFQNYTQAIYDISKSYSLLQENKKKYPDFILNNKGLGIINIFLGSIPDEYLWLFNIAGIQVDVNHGINQINQLLDDTSVSLYHNEMLFFMSIFQAYNTEDKYVWKYYLDKIGEGYKQSLLLNYAAASISKKLGFNDYCIEILENRPVKDRFDFYYLDYLLAMSNLYALNLDKAKIYFEIFLNNFKGRNFIKSAYHKLAWIEYLKNNYKDADVYLTKVMTQGSLLIMQDKIAHNASKKNIFPHQFLLRIRLLYDGAYYSKSMKELDKIENPLYFSNGENIKEYWYRKGRLSQKLEYPLHEVIFSFSKTLQSKEQSNSYFPPMSALQIALIYENKKDYKNANIFFKKCLSFTGFDYQKSIHKKAKKGIKRIKLISKT